MTMSTLLAMTPGTNNFLLETWEADFGGWRRCLATEEWAHVMLRLRLLAYI